MQITKTLQIKPLKLIRYLAGALDSCFVLFGTLQQCAPTEPGGNRTRDLTVRNQVSNRCATSARSRLEFSTSPINDIARIILHCLVCYTYIQRNGWPRNSRLPLDDQLTVDFIHHVLIILWTICKLIDLTHTLCRYYRYCGVES